MFLVLPNYNYYKFFLSHGSCAARARLAARPGDELGGGGSILPMRERGGVHVRLTGRHVIRGSAADVIERTSILADDVW